MQIQEVGRVVKREIRYRRGPSLVRKVHSVSKKGFLGYATRFRKSTAQERASSFWRLLYSVQERLSFFWQFEKFGTGEGLLWYRICARCKKQASVVRDAFSEALGAQNRLLWYRRDIRYRKPPPTVRGASSERITKKRMQKNCTPTINSRRQSNHNYLTSIRRVAGTFSCSTRLGSVMSSTPFTISALTASRSIFSGRVKL